MPLDRWDVEGDVGPTDLYELAMTPEHIRLDLTTQIVIFMYACAKVRILQFRYDLMVEYMNHRYWWPLYTDTNSNYMALVGNYDGLWPDVLKAFYEHFRNWFMLYFYNECGWFIFTPEDIMYKDRERAALFKMTQHNSGIGMETWWLMLQARCLVFIHQSTTFLSDVILNPCLCLPCVYDGLIRPGAAILWTYRHTRSYICHIC